MKYLSFVLPRGHCIEGGRRLFMEFPSSLLVDPYDRILCYPECVIFLGRSGKVTNTHPRGYRRIDPRAMLDFFGKMFRLST